jgi:hypothetical protein
LAEAEALFSRTPHNLDCEPIDEIEDGRVDSEGHTLESVYAARVLPVGIAKCLGNERPSFGIDACNEGRG